MSQPTRQPARPSKSPTPGACGGCCCCSVGDDPEPDDPPWPPRPSPSASCGHDTTSEDAVAATTTLAPLLRPNDCAATAPPSSSPPQESAAPVRRRDCCAIHGHSSSPRSTIQPARRQSRGQSSPVCNDVTRTPTVCIGLYYLFPTRSLTPSRAAESFPFSIRRVYSSMSWPPGRSASRSEGGRYV